jgi:hypothetical protein
MLVTSIDSDNNGYFDEKDIKRFLFKNGLKMKFHEESSFNVSLDHQVNLHQTESFEDVNKYVLTEKDYFKPESKTILNSLEAAIAKAEEIYRAIPEGGAYLDLEFGPKNDKDEEGNKMSLYFTGETPAPGYAHPEEVVWLRPSEFTDEKP